MRWRARRRGEQIRELWINVATLTERVNNVREDIAHVEAAHSRTAAALAELDKKVAVIDERLGELKKTVAEANRRRFALLPPLVGGVAGGIIALLGQLLFLFLRPRSARPLLERWFSWWILSASGYSATRITAGST